MTESASKIAKFQEDFLRRYGATKLRIEFIKLFPVAKVAWEKALAQRGYTLNLMNDDMQDGIETFLRDYDNIQITEENLKIMLARFYQSVLNDFIVNIDLRERHEKIKDEKLWRQALPWTLPWKQLSSRQETKSETARGAQIFGGAEGRPKVETRFREEFLKVVTGQNIAKPAMRKDYWSAVREIDDGVNNKKQDDEWQFAVKVAGWPKRFNNQ